MKALSPLLVLLTLVSCNLSSSPSQNVPNPNPSLPTRGDILGLLDVTINSSTPGKPLEVHFLKGSELNSSSLSSQVFDVQNPSSVVQVCNGSVSFVDDTSVNPPVRYFTGLFKFDNKLASSLTNLTFHAINTSSNINGTAVLNIKTAGGTLLSDPTIAQRMRPTHAMTVGSSGTTVNPSLAHLQAFTSLETLEVQNKFNAAFPTSSAKVLEYGYVAEKIGGGRTIAANDGTACDSGASSAQVAFSYAYPYQSGDTPSSLPFQFNLRFVLSVDSETTVTQSLEEQNDNAGVLIRAKSLGTLVNPVPVRVFSGSSYALGPKQDLCGPLSADPTVAGNRFTVDGQFPLSSITPAPNSMFNAANSSVTATFPTNLASSAGMTVQGFQSSSRLSGFSSAGNALSLNPARAFFPGEEVEVSLTPNIKSTSGLALCSRVSRFRVRSSGTGRLGARQTFGSGRSPIWVAVADLNTDGKLDATLVNTQDNTLSVLLGNGAGGFGFPNTFPVPSRPGFVALGDLNGDGLLDAVGTSANSDTVFVLLRNDAGSGVSFAPATGVVAGMSPNGVALGDLNGDGRLDLVTANVNSSNISALLGDGSGGFGPRRDFAAGTNSQSVALGDLNGDGRLDAVAANQFTDDVSILLGDGAGGFRPQTKVSAGDGPYSVALGDLNRDGRLDAVVSTYNSSEVLVLLGDGLGGLTLVQSVPTGVTSVSVALGDLNGDGRLDAAVANVGLTLDTGILRGDVAVLLWDDALRGGLGGFAPKVSYPAGNNPSSVALGDANGDGALDMFVSTFGSTNLSTFLGGSFGNALDFGDSSSSVVIASPAGSNQTLASTSSYTVEAWVKVPSSLPQSGNALFRILTKNSNTPQNSDPIPYSLFVQNGKVGAALCSSGNPCNPAVLLSSRTLSDDAWHHIAFVRDASLKKLSLLVDGVTQTSVGDPTLGASLTTSRALVLGKIGQGDGLGYGGQLDELRVWNVARAESDILRDKDGTLAQPYPAGLVSYFKLESSSGALTPDEIQFGSSGNLFSFLGNPWVLH